MRESCSALEPVTIDPAIGSDAWQASCAASGVEHGDVGECAADKGRGGRQVDHFDLKRQADDLFVLDREKGPLRPVASGIGTVREKRDSHHIPTPASASGRAPHCQ
jgi:hypothetical protein